MLPRLACGAPFAAMLLSALAGPSGSQSPCDSPAIDFMVPALADGPFDAGEHQTRWAASVTPGLYFARLEAPGGTQRVIRVTRLE